MRDIVFRGKKAGWKQNNEKCWLKGRGVLQRSLGKDIVAFIYGSYDREGSEWTQVDINTVGQGTDIKSLNSDYIFEGDIVWGARFKRDGKNKSAKGVVVYKNGGFWVNDILLKDLENVVIMGNIYEHEKLLEL